MFGGAGADVFRFSSIGDCRIGDFVVGADHIALDRSIFVGIGAAGPLDATAFHVGGSAADASDRIIYSRFPDYAWLLYDPDGNGESQ